VPSIWFGPLTESQYYAGIRVIAQRLLYGKTQWPWYGEEISRQCGRASECGAVSTRLAFGIAEILGARYPADAPHMQTALPRPQRADDEQAETRSSNAALDPQNQDARRGGGRCRTASDLPTCHNGPGDLRLPDRSVGDCLPDLITASTTSGKCAKIGAICHQNQRNDQGGAMPASGVIGPLRNVDSRKRVKKPPHHCEAAVMPSTPGWRARASQLTGWNPMLWAFVAGASD